MRGGRRRRKDKLKIKLGKRLREVTAYLDTDWEEEREAAGRPREGGGVK